MIYATGRDNSSENKIYISCRNPLISSDLRCSSKIENFHAHGSRDASRRQTPPARRRGAPHVRNLKSQNPPGTPNPRKPQGESIPSPKSADYGRDQVRKVGGMLLQHLSLAVFPVGKGLFTEFSYLKFGILSIKASTKVSFRAICCGGQHLPSALPAFSLPPVRVVQPGTEAPGAGSMVAPALTRNVGLWNE